MKSKVFFSLIALCLFVSCAANKKVSATKSDADGHEYAPMDQADDSTQTGTGTGTGTGTATSDPFAQSGQDFAGADSFGPTTGLPTSGDRSFVFDLRWGYQHGYCNSDVVLPVIAAMRTIGRAVAVNGGAGTAPDVAQNDQFISEPNSPCAPNGQTCPMNFTYNSTVTNKDADGVFIRVYSNELVAWNFAVWNGTTWDRADGVFRPGDILRRGIVAIVVGAAIFELRIHTTVGPYLMCY